MAHSYEKKNRKKNKTNFEIFNVCVPIKRTIHPLTFALPFSTQTHTHTYSCSHNSAPHSAPLKLIVGVVVVYALICSNDRIIVCDNIERVSERALGEN